MDSNNKNEQNHQENYLSKLTTLAEFAKKSIGEFTDLAYTIGNMVISYQEQGQKLANQFADIFVKLASFDFDKLKINFYKNAFENYYDFIDTLTRERIFPPINFMIDEEIEVDNYEDLERWILSEEIRDYYLSRILTWKYKFKDEAVNELINEIEVAYKNQMSYSVSLLIFPLIERMLREKLSKMEGHIEYKDLKEAIRENAFEVIGLTDLYNVFIEKNLYCSTKKAEEFSRHISHGVKLNLINQKVSTNMIFIYDYLQEIILES